MFEKAGTRLVWRCKEQILWVEPWGKDSIRVRATTLAEMPQRDWSLLPQNKVVAQASRLCVSIRTDETPLPLHTLKSSAEVFNREIFG
jgi:hypothetical protein